MTALIALQTLGQPSLAAAAAQNAAPAANLVNDPNSGDSEDSQGPEAAVDDDGDEEAGAPITATLTFVSNYVTRGVTQTNGQPALQGSLEWTRPSGFFLGAWGSNVLYPDSNANLELDGFGGYTISLSHELELSLSAQYSGYFNESALNSWSFPLTLRWKAFTIGLEFIPKWQWVQPSEIAPAAVDEIEEAGEEPATGEDIKESRVWYLSTGWKGPLAYGLEGSLAAGYSFFESSKEFDYADVRIGLSREFLDLTWNLETAFVSHKTLEGTAYGPRAIVSVSKSF